MNRKRFLLTSTLTLLSLSLLAGCSRSGEGTVATTITEKPPVAVDVAVVSPGELSNAIEVTGTLQPRFAADIKSEYTALVDEVMVTEWVRVDKGDSLARLDTRDADTALELARAGVAQAEVQENRAERELERAEKLKQAGLMTQQALDDARSARDAARAATAATRAQLEGAETYRAKTVIRAPFAGVVAVRNVNPGDRVESMGGPALFRIVDPRQLELVVNVPSVRLASLAVGQPLEFVTNAFPGRTFTGEVSFINPEIDPASRSVRVVARVPNPGEELRGGLFVTGHIVTGTRRDVLLAPRAALAAWNVEQGQAEVFTVVAERAQRRSVETGTVAGEVVEIRSGLSAGDQVVIRGGYNLKDGDRLTVAQPSA